MSRLNEIKTYLENKEIAQNEINYILTHSVYLSMVIADYAHEGQFRENGDKYSSHPRRCMFSYQNMVGIVDNDPFCIDTDLMEKYNIPFDGVQEVCLLHDVLEDTDFTINDLLEIFKQVHLDSYFDQYIKEPLLLITHKKDMEYKDYIDLCMTNRTSALVKIIDLSENTNSLTVDMLDDYTYQRTIKYLNYIYIINNKYHFVENILKYKKEYQEHKVI